MNAVRSQLRFAALLAFALQAMSSTVAAQRWTKSSDGTWIPVVAPPAQPSVFAADDKLRLFGVSLLLGLPEGIAPGVSIHPGTNLVHLDVALTSLLSLGVRGGVTLDPFDWIIAPTLTIAGGYSAWAKLPSTMIRYELVYLNIQPGLEWGRRSRFRVFLRAGYSHFWVTGQSSTEYRGVEATSGPNVRISFWPSVNLGITAYFGE